MGAVEGEPDPASTTTPEPTSIGKGRAGPVRSRLRRALKEARDAQRMTTEHEVRALVAERYADAVDRAAARNDEKAMLAAADKLLEVLDTLPVRTPGGGGAGDGSGNGGAVGLHAVLDSPPTLGDTAHA